MTPYDVKLIKKGARVRYHRSADRPDNRVGVRYRYAFGTVIRRRGGRVFVHWDRTSFEDERLITEIRPIGVPRHPSGAFIKGGGA